MINNQQIISVIETSLKDALDRPGSIVHSPSATLTQGNYYFIGFNPGGNHNDYRLKDELTNLLNKSTHRYIDEIFEQAGHRFAKGQAPLQKNYQALFNYLNQDPRTVFCTNLIFFHSRRSHGVDYLKDANQCWPVHQALLALIKPNVIICNGNGNSGSAYRYLYQTLASNQPEQVFGTVYSTASIKFFTTRLNGKEVKVIGIPHLSRFYPSPYMETIKQLVV